MQTLSAADLYRQYNLKEELPGVPPDEVTPAHVSVREDLEKKIITLAVGANDLYLSRQQAHTLARALRQAANRLGALEFQEQREKKKRK